METGMQGETVVVSADTMKKRFFLDTKSIMNNIYKAGFWFFIVSVISASITVFVMKAYFNHKVWEWVQLGAIVYYDTDTQKHRYFDLNERVIKK